MTDPILEVLRAVDPARSMPPAPSATREAIRARIRDTEHEGRMGCPLVTSRGPRTHRRMFVAVAAVLVAVIPLGGWAYISYFMNRETVVDEFRAAQREMSLPPGVAWETPDLPADVTYGGRYGFMEAWQQSTNAWLREWIAAHEAGDRVRERAAVTAVERQVSLMPLHKRGDPEEVGGFDITCVQQMQGLVEKMKQGDLSAVEYYLELNP